jgi:sugar phosphate isomerase/epimerase
MRLGGPIFTPYADPNSWVDAVKALGYRAAYCPIGPEADDATARAYAAAAAENDIVIAEVGAWSNPLSRDAVTRQAALDLCKRSLDLADRIEARCCVNIAGSLGEVWSGPAIGNLSEETFQLIVDSVREIIDAVKPRRTFYTLEPMPWVHPDSPDSYLRLIHAIDRPAFAVHLDPVNMINCPQRYLDNAAFLRECFRKLGPYIKSVHAKDIFLHDTYTVHLEERRPGLGQLDYRTFLHEAAALENDVPLMVEHLPNADEYQLAVDYIRAVARSEQLML